MKTKMTVANQERQTGNFKSGFVGIIGRPNVGKSTLLNYLAQRKLAIISDKPQTTRHRIKAIINYPGGQAVFIDTPGLHKPRDPLGARLNALAHRTLAEVDMVLFMIDVSETIGSGDAFIAGQIADLNTPVIIVANKIDELYPSHLEIQLDISKSLGPYPMIAVSGLHGTNIGCLLSEVFGLLPAGPQYYPHGMLTDQPEAVIVAELVREKLLEVTREEVPYSLAVYVEEMSSRRGRDLIDIRAKIFVERESQKGIVIGHQGKVLQMVGSKARQEIEALLGSHVNLDLMVTVKKDWRQSERMVGQLGY